ncbi:hypothetical protein FOA43_002260 [Brettanomyces nanus]|uniref:J domain-containing protein n=1 Tax=Eeniella nana TaxID=13502 RepID=A0A875S4C9_EENNA|nr:uncharacterized protein FOA43_002260 [Brettanomyces nanus]QPG74922.1 hypothetical protein FOA43_002260 [Brettanomyces nanus]
MSDSRYDYDENSETWPYFVLTGILVPLVPVTFSLISSHLGKGQVKDDGFEQVSWCEPYDSKQLNQFRSKQKRSSLFTGKFFLVVLGWFLVGLLAFKIGQIDIVVSETNFDPWKILEIDETANVRDIRTAYRKLSLKFHPDKVDTSNMTRPEIDAYGNPDGPGDIKHGIALPKFLVDGPTSPLFVVVYILLIAVILPLCVSKWWSGVKSHTRRGIYTDTASHFLTLMLNFNPAELVQVKTVLKDVASSREYLDIDPKLNQDKVLELLLDHINRKLLSPKEETLKLSVVAITPKLLLGFLDIAAAFRNTDVCNVIVEAHRCIIQALNIEDDVDNYKYRQILQLPSIELDNIDKKQKIYTLGKLLKKPTDDPAKFLGVDSESTTKKVLDYAKHIPLIEPLDCQFKVPGENYIPPNSHVNIDLRFIVKSPAHKSKPARENLSPEVIDTQLKEPDILENLRNPLKVVELQPLLSLKSAPMFFPDIDYVKDHCGWAAFILVQKDGRLGEAPVFLSRADLSNMNLTQEQFLKSDAKVSVFKLMLTAPAPPQEGSFQFRLVLKNLVYFGSDIEIPLTMNVENKPEFVGKDVYKIEEPDEDSLAGAMAQLRGEKVKKSKEYSSDEESDSEDQDDDNDSDSEDDDDDDDDDDEDGDWTDINTDTETEED